MRFLLILILLLLQASPAFAKPKNCMTRAEQTSEWQIRHAIRLREFAWRCDEPPYSAGTLEIWKRIDEKNAAQFKKMTDARAKVFEREFPTQHKTYLENWNGRIIIRYRDYYLSNIDCAQTKQQLLDIDKKGFGAFTKMAGKYKPEVLMDYRICG
ncbi:MAG: hypothetical protein HQL44_15820 [Alphaproteobacteria bacterium]|nr:hypothetical protein [Alphaproteobacteria bacterium]